MPERTHAPRHRRVRVASLSPSHLCALRAIRCARARARVCQDPDRIGFALGGIDPGKLHSHGELVEWHHVYYAVGRAGRYLLHVGMRSTGEPLPGSPFQLEVAPGPAHAASTGVPLASLPLHAVIRAPRGAAGGTMNAATGFVGMGAWAADAHLAAFEAHPAAGALPPRPFGVCRLLLPTCDKIGNRCTRGGAHVTCGCRDASARIDASCVDMGDGTYALSWRGIVPGRFRCFVQIDGLHVLGSPLHVTFEWGAATPFELWEAMSEEPAPLPDVRAGVRVGTSSPNAADGTPPVGPSVSEPLLPAEESREEAAKARPSDEEHGAEEPLPAMEMLAVEEVLWSDSEGIE